MRSKNALRAALAVALVAGSAGCYGPFRLTNKLYNWNGEGTDKWKKEAIFLGLTVIPVYELSLLADAIVFNSLEFWGQRNPAGASTRSLEKDGRQAVLRYDDARRRLRIDGFENGRHRSTLVIEPGPEGMVARDEAGRVLMSARTEGGSVIVR